VGGGTLVVEIGEKKYKKRVLSDAPMHSKEEEGFLLEEHKARKRSQKNDSSRFSSKEQGAL